MYIKAKICKFKSKLCEYLRIERDPCDIFVEMRLVILKELYCLSNGFVTKKHQLSLDY